jgi:outer membrane protein
LNPELAATRRNIDLSEVSLRQSIRARGPVMSAQSSVGVVSRGGDIDRRFIDETRSVELSVEQPLFEGKNNTLAIRARRLRLEEAIQSYRDQAQNIILETVRAFESVRLAQRRLEAQRELEVSLNELVRSANARFRVTEATRTDVAQSEARLARARADTVAARSALEASLARLTAVVGFEIAMLAEADSATDPASAYSLLSFDEPTSLEQAQTIGFDMHPRVLAAQAREDAADIEASVIRLSAGPKWSATASVERTWDERAAQPGRSEFTAAARLRVPLLDRSQADSETRRARLVAEQAALERQQTALVIEQLVRNAWSDRIAAQARLEAVQAQTLASQVAARGVRAEAAEGLRTNLDILDAEQELLEARLAVIEAESDKRVARFALFAALGQLASISDVHDANHGFARFHERGPSNPATRDGSDHWFGSEQGASTLRDPVDQSIDVIRTLMIGEVKTQ